MNIKHKILIAFAGLLLLGGTSPAWARGGGGGHGGGGDRMGAGDVAAGNMGGFNNGHPNNQQGIEESMEKKGIEGTEEGKHLGQDKNVIHRRTKTAHRATPAVPATPATPAVPPTSQMP